MPENEGDTRVVQELPTYVPVVLKKGEVPKGAVMMTKYDIIKLQQERLDRCDSTTTQSLFRFSKHMLGISTTITAIIVNNHFRRTFSLFNYGMAFSYMPTVCLPTLLTLFADHMLTTEVLLRPDCPTCHVVKSGVIQAGLSTVYSSVIAPISGIYLSRKYFTYQARNNFQPNMRHALKSTPKTRISLLILLANNFAIGALIRYKQIQRLDEITERESAHMSRELLVKVME